MPLHPSAIVVVNGKNVAWNSTPMALKSGSAVQIGGKGLNFTLQHCFLKGGRGFRFRIDSRNGEEGLDFASSFIFL